MKLTGPNRYEESTVDSFTRNLPELLSAMSSYGQSLYCIAEFGDRRYVQFRVSSATTVVEIVSNRFLGETTKLSDADEENLRRLGFREPKPDSIRHPNWRYEEANPQAFLHVAKKVATAVFFALHASANDIVNIKTFEVPSSSGACQK
jgi:hypothetical protein